MKVIATAVLKTEFLKTHPERTSNYYSSGCVAVKVISVSAEATALMKRYADKWDYAYEELDKDPDEDTFFPACCMKNNGEWVLAPAYDDTNRFVIRPESGDDDIFLTFEELSETIDKGIDPAVMGLSESPSCGC